MKKLLKEVDMKEGRMFSGRGLGFSFFFFSSFFFPFEDDENFCQSSRFLSDELREEKEKYKAVCDDMDATFAEMTGY